MKNKKGTNNAQQKKVQKNDMQKDSVMQSEGKPNDAKSDDALQNGVKSDDMIQSDAEQNDTQQQDKTEQNAVVQQDSVQNNNLIRNDAEQNDTQQQDKTEQNAIVQQNSVQNNNLMQSDTEQNNVQQVNDKSQEDTTATDTPASAEDNLEIRKMKFKDRMAAKKARIISNMEGMSKKEKAKYIIYYYKWHAFAVVLILFCLIYFPVTIYLNKRPVGISYAILNNTGNLNLDVFDDYMDFYGLGNDYQIIKNTAVYLDLDTYEEQYEANPNSTNFTQFPTLCYTGYYDVMITDAAGMEYCSVNSLIQALDGALDQDMYDKLTNDYSERIVQSMDYSENVYDYGIDISDTEFAKSLNLSYDEVYLCFFGLTDQNITNADRLLNFIFKF